VIAEGGMMENSIYGKITESVRLAIHEVDDLYAMNLHPYEEAELIARVMAYIKPLIMESNPNEQQGGDCSHDL
jgi:hypothetical protein